MGKVVNSYALERPELAKDWTAVQFYAASDKPWSKPTQRFEAGEPAHLLQVFLSLPGFPKGEDALWWIQGFQEENQEAYALVTADREGTKVRMKTKVQNLRKLNAMERLAAEYAF
jgi:hypothetical protein